MLVGQHARCFCGFGHRSAVSKARNYYLNQPVFAIRRKGLARVWQGSGKDLVSGITNRYCSPSFETATRGLLRMRSNLLKHHNLMLRSERRERLEAWAASDSPISHSRYWQVPECHP